MKYDFRNKTSAPVLKEVPHTECDCFECQQRSMHSQQVTNRLKNYTGQFRPNVGKPKDHFLSPYHSDNLDSNPQSYMDAILVGSKPVKIWDKPGVSKGGKVIETRSAGMPIGRVYSYSKDVNGAYWLQLMKPDVDPNGKLVDSPIIGYTPFIPDYFDKVSTQLFLDKYKSEQQAKIDSVVNKRIEENKRNNALYAFGSDPTGTIGNFLGTIKWYLIIVAALIIAYLLLKR